MEARGFVVNTTDKLKDLKKLLVEYDSKVHNEVVVPVAPVAPVVLSSCWCNKPDNNDMVHSVHLSAYVNGCDLDALV